MAYADLPAWEWWAGIIAATAGSVIGSILCISQTRNMCLERKQRQSVIDRTEQSIGWTILLSLYFFDLTMIIVVLGKQPFVRKSCSLITHSGTVTYMLGKCFMYLVFIVRLYVVYKNSMYRYEFRSIRIVAICTVTISFILILVVAFQIHPIHRQGEQYYLSECQAVLNVYIGALVVLYDLTLSIGSTIAFIKPLRHLIRCTQPLEDADQSSLIEIATKYAILTIVASITTFVLIIGSGLGLGSLTPLDLICNMICLVLMTRYYNEKKYYDVLCWIPIQCSSCCIWCCCAQPAPPIVTTLSTKLSNVRANSEANHAQIEQPKVRTELDQESNAPQQP